MPAIAARPDVPPLAHPAEGELLSARRAGLSLSPTDHDP